MWKDNLKRLYVFFIIGVFVVISIVILSIVMNKKGVSEMVDSGATADNIKPKGISSDEITYSSSHTVSQPAVTDDRKILSKEEYYILSEDERYDDPKVGTPEWVPGTVPSKEQALDLLYDAALDVYAQMGIYRGIPIIVSDPWSSNIDDGGFSCFINNEVGTTVLCGHADKTGAITVWLYGSEYHKGFNGIMYAYEYKNNPSAEDIKKLEKAIISDPKSEKTLQIEWYEGNKVYLVDEDGRSCIYDIGEEVVYNENSAALHKPGDYSAYREGDGSSTFVVRANKERESVEKVWITSSSASGKTYAVNGYFNIDAGALVKLTGNTDYSESNISTMLLNMDNLSGDEVGFRKALPEVYDFYKRTNVDIAGMLAMIVTAGNVDMKSGAVNWNFYNTRTPLGGTPINGKELWDAKSDCSTIGEALVDGFWPIFKTYLSNGQDSFYLMSFNKYGFPQSDSEAQDSPVIDHAFMPWYEDSGYISSGFDDYYAWCNKCARNREMILKGVE